MSNVPRAIRILHSYFRRVRLHDDLRNFSKLISGVCFAATFLKLEIADEAPYFGVKKFASELRGRDRSL